MGRRPNGPPPTAREVRDKAQAYYVTYKRHSTAVALMWGIFTCGFVVLNVVVFIQPQWIGRFESSSSSLTNPGYVGLYEHCEIRNHGFELKCGGQFYRWDTIRHTAFRASTFFVGVSCLVIWICILLFFLFFVIKPVIVFTVCGVLQLISAIFMFLGCLIFPAGWNDPDVLNICGAGSDQYVIADCKLGWAYILAMVGVVDALFLSILAFVLAARQTEWTDNIFTDDPRHDDYNDDTASSKHSMFISPGLAAGHDHERYSEFSHSTKRSRRSDFAL